MSRRPARKPAAREPSRGRLPEARRAASRAGASLEPTSEPGALTRRGALLFATGLDAYDSPSDAPARSSRTPRSVVFAFRSSGATATGGSLSDPRLAYVSEYGPALPSTQLALGTAAVDAAIAALGVLAIRTGLRSRRPT